MIRPGLERITKLLSGIPIQWKAIHVAGTNGKGSVCAYLSAMLHGAGIRAGRFTSPHLIDKWDCITIDEKPISKSIFYRMEERVKLKNSKESIDASEFELLTATAFQIFNEEKVRVAVIECGMGGKLDATNVLTDPLATIITAIAMDHQGFLGDTLEQIADHKAGILKHRVPCVVNPMMNQAALARIFAAADAVDAIIVPQTEMTDATTVRRPEDEDWYREILDYVDVAGKTTFQASNMWCALKAMENVLPKLESNTATAASLAPIMLETSLPGRLQTMSIERVTGREEPVLLDGAHNTQAFHALVQHVDDKMRQANSPVTWVLAMSKGKDASRIFGRIAVDDNVVVTAFGPVDGMPWVEPARLDDFEFLREGGIHLTSSPDIKSALITATDLARGNPLVIAGSLYLVSDVLRLLRQS